MQIMNSEKSLGLQVNSASNGQYDYTLSKNALETAPESGGDMEEPSVGGRNRLNNRDRVHSSTVNTK
jgi:hypothetical protein